MTVAACGVGHHRSTPRMPGQRAWRRPRTLDVATSSTGVRGGRGFNHTGLERADHRPDLLLDRQRHLVAPLPLEHELADAAAARQCLQVSHRGADEGPAISLPRLVAAGERAAGLTDSRFASGTAARPPLVRRPPGLAISLGRREDDCSSPFAKGSGRIGAPRVGFKGVSPLAPGRDSGLRPHGGGRRHDRATARPAAKTETTAGASTFLSRGSAGVAHTFGWRRLVALDLDARHVSMVGHDRAASQSRLASHGRWRRWFPPRGRGCRGAEGVLDEWC